MRESGEGASEAVGWLSESLPSPAWGWKPLRGGDGRVWHIAGVLPMRGGDGQGRGEVWVTGRQQEKYLAWWDAGETSAAEQWCSHK